MSIEQLNADFSLDGQLSFVTGKGGFPLIAVKNADASALISIYGGQVLSFQPNEATEEVLFLSDTAYYQEGKAIKGGVPICWPWFGADPDDKGRPSHGFVRNRMWSVLSTTANDNSSTTVVLGLQDTPETQEIWPNAFRLALEITIGKTLHLALVTHNTGEQTFSITQALHTYFKMGDITKTSVHGLDGMQYIDNSAKGNKAVKSQSGTVTISEEVDRIYTDISGDLTVFDETLNRNIHITSSGSKTAVVWNPWVDIAAKMGDLQDNDYLRFVCVETANAADDIVEIPAGETFRLIAEYRL